MSDARPATDHMPAPAPSAEEIRAQLERILESTEFGASDRQRRFLGFVVDATLAGDADRIKGYTIATEVFDRGDDFDPQLDPIVRVEAGRLRRRLEHYYLSDGAEDTVLIEIPKGRYVAKFSYRETANESLPIEASAATGPVAAPATSKLQLAGVFAIGLVAILVAVGTWQFTDSDQPAPSADSAEGGVTRAVVLPFEYATDTEVHPFLNDGLLEELIVTLAALPDVEVVALGSARQVTDQQLTQEQVAETLQADVIISGYVRQQQQDVRVTVTVADAPGTVVRLSQRFDGTLEDVFGLQERISREIAAAIGASTAGPFERRLLATRELDPETVALYYQAATLRDPPSDPARSQLAEDAYRQIIERSPDFAGGHAGLAYVLAFRSWWRVGEQPETDGDAALVAARTAVATDAEFGWSQMSLGLAELVQGDHDEALAAAQRAALLAPNDPYVLSFSALVQSFAGDREAAIPLAEAAIRLDPLSPRTPYRNILGALLFQSGRYDESLAVLEENLRLGGPDGPHMAYWRAGSLAALGREDEARSELAHARSFPYNFDMRDFLRAFRDPAEAGKLFALLEPLNEPSLQ